MSEFGAKHAFTGVVSLVLLTLASCCTTAVPSRDADSEKVVTFESLLDEMIDLERLVEYPGSTYRCKQASSYDRRSTDPNVTSDENWFANLDVAGLENLQQFVRVEGEGDQREFVLMDAEGPGVIVWIWVAANIENFAGNIRIYLDHSPQPVIDMKMDDLLGGDRPRTYFLSPNRDAKPFKGILTGDEVPFPSPITGQYSFGWNSYLPIPYARHCKVVTTAVNSKPYYWYQIAYRQYEPGVTVASFSHHSAIANADKIVEVAKKLEHPMNQITPLKRAGMKTSSKKNTAELQAGQSTTIEIKGHDQAIYRLSSTIHAENIDQALRGCLLEIRFDGEKTVECPLGDFYATAPGTNCYESLPSAVIQDGTMISNWIMPFRRSASIAITNHTGMPVSVETSILLANRPWQANTMYFYANWRAQNNIPTRPRRDWNYADIHGAGRYLGNMLHVANPNKNWWGEGDAKIWFDGETFPSIFGTGTEDYYGYAMCWRDLFTHAYHNQTHCEKPGNSGHTCLSRFHVLDDLPFSTSFRFDIEIWHLEDCLTNYAATSWWYALPGARHKFQPLHADELRIPQLPKPKDRKGKTGWVNE